jgi:alkylation response protein AidB-like acyl-CoA dehydrogenase
MARLRAKPAGLERLTGADAAAIRRRAQIGIAAEAAGLMRGALDNTVAYVKEREQYGQPLGHFQAIQHRLAEDAQIVRAAKLLALRAAFEDSDRQAAIACLYAQDAMRKVIYDCHQFSGAMGLTLEFPLHLWTYRLKVLQGEAGGRAAQGRVVSRETWGASQVGAAAEPVAEGVA